MRSGEIKDDVRVPMRLLLTPIIVLLATQLLWQSSSLRPAVAAPSTQRSADIRRWFEQLADPDPSVRDSARQNLMGLPRSDLAELRRVITESRPLVPAQAAGLRDIVTHVYLASQRYDIDRKGRGFMGVSLLQTQFGADLIEGAVVQQRFPGLVANQMLRDGDVIVGAEESTTQIDNPQTLQAVVGDLRAGQTVHLKVQRAAKLIVVPITLDF